MQKPATVRDHAGKGYKNCPVCGCRYQGSLERHLDQKIKGSGGITRCDWRLCEARIFTKVVKLKEAGWRLAGSTGARFARLLSYTHPHLAQLTTSGSIMTKVHASNINPANDLKAWWVQRWTYPLLLTPGIPGLHRIRLIAEIEPNQEAQDAIEAAWAIGGADAVKGLEGTAYAKRCDARYGDPRHELISRGSDKVVDRCILPKDHLHGIAHMGLKTGVLWGGGPYPPYHDLVYKPKPLEPGDMHLDEGDLRLSDLFEKQEQADDW